MRDSVTFNTIFNSTHGKAETWPWSFVVLMILEGSQFHLTMDCQSLIKRKEFYISSNLFYTIICLRLLDYCPAIIRNHKTIYSYLSRPADWVVVSEGQDISASVSRFPHISTEIEISLKLCTVRNAIHS